MVELLRALPSPLADWLDDEFESEQLKGAVAALARRDVARRDVRRALRSLLHRHVGAARA